MQPALTAAIAVLGTLLGSTMTYFFQRRHAMQANLVASRERIREERISSCSNFVGAVADLRGAQLLRWNARREYSAESDEYARVRSESWRLRAVARTSMYRVQLTAENEAFAKSAHRLVEVTIEILDAVDEADLAIRAERSTTLTEEFIAVARKTLDSVASSWPSIARIHG